MAALDCPITLSNDDGYFDTSKTSYPTAVTDNPFASTSGTIMYVQRTFATPNYSITTGHLRFDTSGLPDDCTVTAAVLKLYIISHSNTDTLNLCGEWYLGSQPHDSSDWTADAATDAFAVALSSLTDTAVNEFTLTNPGAEVNLTGYTGLRLAISKRAADAAPTGANGIEAATWDNATYVEPVLAVTYTPVGGDLQLLMLLGVG